MKYFTVILCMLFMLTACNERKLNDTQVKGLDGAKKNVEAVAEALHDVAPKAGEVGDVVKASAQILDSQVATIELVLPAESLSETEQGVSTVNKEKLIVNPEQAAQETIAKDDANREDIKSSTSMWQKITSWTGWAGVVGIASTLALTAQRIFIPALSPYLSDPIIRSTPIVGKFMRQAEQGTETIDKYRGLVGDSLIARTALMKLDEKMDPELKARLLPFLQQLAGSNVNGIEDLFKHTANANSVDRGANSETRELLNEVRDVLPTVGGVPIANPEAVTNATT